MTGPVIITDGNRTRFADFDPVSVVMHCDVAGCLRQPKRAPRLVIPAWAPPFIMPPIKIMTTLHYCDHHHDAFDVAAYLTDAQKAKIEDTARKMRPLGWRPDFERVHVEYLLVTTPEYREFLKSLGVKQHVFG